SDKSTSPRYEGERTEVRGYSLRDRTGDETLTLPSPLQRERRLQRAACFSFQTIVQSSAVDHLSESLLAHHRDLSEIHGHPVQMRRPSNNMAGTLPFRKNERLAPRTPGQSNRSDPRRV